MSAQPQRNRRSNSPASKTVPGLAARRVAADLLYGVLVERRALDQAFEGKHGKGEHAASDQALTQALVLTALRRLPTLDAAINACLDKPLHESAASSMCILRIMAVQLLVMDMADHAAVTLAVEDASRRKDARKLKGLINAIGRRMVREKQALKDRPPVVDLSPWLDQRWTRTHGKEATHAIAKVMRTQPAIDLCLKPDTNRQALMEALAEGRTGQIAAAFGDHGIRLISPGSIEALPGYTQGQWWVQDAAAALPAHMLLAALQTPKGANVLDMCAAPGGKTAQLASAGCTVTALDQSSRRMQRLASNMKRLNLDVTSVVSDALIYHAPGFDAVLLDAPCSATGTLRRNPDIAYLRRDQDITALASLQAKLLTKAAKLTKPGGVLVYATCSLEPEEGEAQITRFLRDNKDWRIEAPKSEGLPEKATRPDGTVRILPSMSPPALEDGMNNGMDGFFIATLRAPS